MAKNSSHRRRSQTKTRTRRQGQRGGGGKFSPPAQHGGELAGNPPSSWGWGLGTAGNGWTQFMNSLTLQPGANLGTIQSNNLVPVGNINAQNAQGNIGPNMTGDIPKGGGRRRRRAKSMSNNATRRGGSWEVVASQAAVPGILLAAQQTFGKSRKHKR